MAGNSGQTNSAGSNRLGLGSFELPSADSFSRKKVRSAFIRALEPGVALSLYKKAFFHFVLVAWSQSPQAIPPPVVARLDDKGFLAELERVTSDFSASPFNAERQSVEPAFIELLSPVFNLHRELVINNPRGVLIRELLRSLRDLYETEPPPFLSWKTLQEIENAEQLRVAIIEWSQYWNLDADWCRDYAVAALFDWLTDRWVQFQVPSDDGGLSFYGAAIAVHRDDIWTAPFQVESSPTGDTAKLLFYLTQGFTFTWRGLDFHTQRWNPLSSYRGDWARDCEERFKEYLARREQGGGVVPTGLVGKFRSARDRYIREMEKAAEEAGLVRTPRRWAEEHITWSVRFQVQRWPLSKIEKTYSKPRKTIADGVNRLLKFIDLTRRDNLRSGMPKGTRLQNKRRIVRK